MAAPTEASRRKVMLRASGRRTGASSPEPTTKTAATREEDRAAAAWWCRAVARAPRFYRADPVACPVRGSDGVSEPRVERPSSAFGLEGEARRQLNAASALCRAGQRP